MAIKRAGTTLWKVVVVYRKQDGVERETLSSREVWRMHTYIKKEKE
jgi:hypothetical protein